jgi:hypothetical protein
MPKHQGNLDFIITDDEVSSRYDLDGKMVMRVVVRRSRPWLPLRAGAVNYCSYRGMLFKSYIYFKGKIGFSLFRKGSARIELGDHPRAQALRELNIGDPIFAGFFPETAGTLDDHFECWFESFAAPPARRPEGFESVIDLPLSEEWLPPPGSPEAGSAAQAVGAGAPGGRASSIQLGDVPVVGEPTPRR